MKDRKNCCPKCGYELLCREGDNIICLRCDWEIESKRQDDEELFKISELKEMWK